MWTNGLSCLSFTNRKTGLIRSDCHKKIITIELVSSYRYQRISWLPILIILCILFHIRKREKKVWVNYRWGMGVELDVQTFLKNRPNYSFAFWHVASRECVNLEWHKKLKQNGEWVISSTSSANIKYQKFLRFSAYVYNLLAVRVGLYFQNFIKLRKKIRLEIK